MHSIARFAFFAALFLFASTSVHAQDDWYKMAGTKPANPKRALSRPSALTNDSILSFVEAELSDDVIVRRINSSGCRFDISAPAIAELKARGVSKAVLEAMITVSTPPPNIPASERASSPIGAKFYIAPMPDGFDGFISAEF